jgi:hypothetical protein
MLVDEFDGFSHGSHWSCAVEGNSSIESGPPFQPFKMLEEAVYISHSQMSSSLIDGEACLVTKSCRSMGIVQKGCIV